MRTVRFGFPSGGPEAQEPSEDLLRDLIFKKDEDFWQSGSGTGELTYSDGDFNAQLMLTIKEPQGVFVFYSRWGEGDEYVATIGDQGSKTVTVNFGGDSRILPEHYFIPRERAWEAVKEFCNNGKKIASLKWIIYDPPETE